MQITETLCRMRIDALRRCLCSAVVVMALIGCCNSQSSDSKQCSIAILENSSGWNIPGLKGARETDEPDQITTLSNDKVKVHRLIPGESVSDLTIFRRDQPGVLRIWTRRAQVLELYKFVTEGRTFAYFVVCAWEPPRPDLVVSGTCNVTFTDPDGRGVFTQMKHGPLILPLQPPLTKID